jgi:hypothetical protein
MRHNILMPIMNFMTKYFLKSNRSGRYISVPQLHPNILLITFIALASVVISCEEGPTSIGLGMLPGKDFVSLGSIDTLSTRSYTVYDDSTRTDLPSVSYLGRLYDPYFGTTDAGFVTQIRLSGSWEPVEYIIDSVKLFLKLDNVSGDVTTAHYLNLKEISDEIYVDTAYYSNTPVNFTGYEISNIELPTLQADTINNIAISLPVQFGYYLTRDTSMFFYDETKPDFRSYFRGLSFSMTSASNPVILRLSLASPGLLSPYNNYFVIYYHDTDNVFRQFMFVLDAVNTNASFNRFVHNYSSATSGIKISHINDGYLDTLSYLQYLNGVYTRINIPGLENIKKDPSFRNVAVNKARLIVPVFVDGDVYKPSTVASQIYLLYKTPAGTKNFVPDFYIDQYHVFFDGAIDTINLRYKFNISAFVQKYLDDATDGFKPEVDLILPSNIAKSAILKANSSKTPVKFEFTYTKF